LFGSFGLDAGILIVPKSIFFFMIGPTTGACSQFKTSVTCLSLNLLCEVVMVIVVIVLFINVM